MGKNSHIQTDAAINYWTAVLIFVSFPNDLIEESSTTCGYQQNRANYHPPDCFGHCQSFLQDWGNTISPRPVKPTILGHLHFLLYPHRLAKLRVRNQTRMLVLLRRPSRARQPGP